MQEGVAVQELEQRYSRFRVEVQSAMDRNEAGVSYESIAKRITGREVSEAQAGGKLPLLRASHAPQKTATGQGEGSQSSSHCNAISEALLELVHSTRLLWPPACQLAMMCHAIAISKLMYLDFYPP